MLVALNMARYLKTTESRADRASDGMSGERNAAIAESDAGTGGEGRQLMRMTSNTCRNCGGTLVGEPLSGYNGNGMLDNTDKPSWLEYDGAKHFIKCQQCSATNILVISEDPNGTSVLTITRAMIEDD
jgi:hypothetical protein